MKGAMILLYLSREGSLPEAHPKEGVGTYIPPGHPRRGEHQALKLKSREQGHRVTKALLASLRKDNLLPAESILSFPGCWAYRAWQPCRRLPVLQRLEGCSQKGS